MKSLFPQDMLSSSGGELSLDLIAAKLTHFVDQLHLLHWQTTSYAEHQALGGLYDKMFDFKDEIVEKVMGYSGKRPVAVKHDMLINHAPGVSSTIVGNIITFSAQLQSYAASNGMPDIENIAQSLSGEAAKTKYLLTLS